MYYFISDTHLGLNHVTSSVEREKRVVGWLEEVSHSAKAIFLVGDIFDFWFEYRRVIPKGFTRLLGKLSELTDRGVEVHFFAGNHDMWAYDYLQTECGVKLHHKPEMFTLCGKQVFVAHGDNMYLRKPLNVRIMHMVFRSRPIRWLGARLIHPDLLMRFGHWWSQKSRKAKHVKHQFRGEAEYLVRYAREYMKVVKVDYFVFGHLHTLANYDMGDGVRAVFLGEWISDTPYAVLDQQGNIEFRKYEQ